MWLYVSHFNIATMGILCSISMMVFKSFIYRYVFIYTISVLYNTYVEKKKLCFFYKYNIDITYIVIDINFPYFVKDILKAWLCKI